MLGAMRTLAKGSATHKALNNEVKKKAYTVDVCQLLLSNAQRRHLLNRFVYTRHDPGMEAVHGPSTRDFSSPIVPGYYHQVLKPTTAEAQAGSCDDIIGWAMRTIQPRATLNPSIRRG